MGLVAFVTRQKKLKIEEWERYAKTNPAFERPGPREVLNPFTRTRTIVEPSEGEFNIDSDGLPCGAVVPSSEFSEDGELHVYAPDQPSEQLRRIISDTARALNAEVCWLTDEESGS